MKSSLMADQKLLFAYGTLQIAEVLNLILGGDVFEEVVAGNAFLSEHQAFYVEGEDYPILKKVSGHTVPGILLRLYPNQLEKIVLYEDPEDYELKSFEVHLDIHKQESSCALVFWPKEKLKISDQPWSLGEWHKGVDLNAYLSKVKGWIPPL